MLTSEDNNIALIDNNIALIDLQKMQINTVKKILNKKTKTKTKVGINTYVTTLLKSLF